MVGAGNAGCVVARRLSDAGYSVLVLEKGFDWNLDKDSWKLVKTQRLVYQLLRQGLMNEHFQSDKRWMKNIRCVATYKKNRFFLVQFLVLFTKQS